MAPRQSSWEVAIRSSRSQHFASNVKPTQDDDSNGGPRDAKEAKVFWVSEVGKLSSEHRARFLRCAPSGTYEEYVTMLTQSVGDTVNASKVAKLSRKMKPVFQLSNLIAPILSSATQANSMPASIILGGITCILSLTTRLDDFQTKVIETLESMCDQIQLVDNRQPESPTDNDAHVLACGVEVATDVFNFCAQVAKLFYDENGKEKSSFVLVLRTFGKDFDARFGDVKSSFQRHMNMWEKRRWLANQRLMESMNDEIHGIGELLRHDVYKREGLVSDQHQAGKEAERARQAEERRRFLDWLPSPNFGQIQEDNLRRCVEGSGDWLLNHKDFNAWRTGRDSSILWIHGRPGSGKSHLASRIIADFDPSKGTDNPAVAYAFCTTTQMKTEMTMSNLLSSILKQLYGQLPLSESIESLLSQFATGSRDEMQRSTMMEGIRKVISRLPSTLIIVDGLDECKDFPDKQFEDFCNFLASLAKLQGTKDAVKLLVLSRRNSEAIQKSLSGCREVQIDRGASIEDIKAYISREVDEIHESPSEEERAGLEEIKTKLFGNADGNFLWVQLRTKLLKEEGSVEDMNDALQDSTGGLNELFTEELGKILSNTKQKVRLRALKALQLVTNSYRALSKEELLEALSVRPGRTSITESQRIIPSAFSTTHCADLMVEEEGFFKLRHASLKDFLSSQLAALGDYGKLQQNAHRDLAEICLTYLNFDRFGSAELSWYHATSKLHNEYPLLLYATAFWGQHFAQCHGQQDEILMGLLSRLLGNKASMIVLLQIRENQSSVWRLSNHATPLHTLAAFDLVDVADGLPNSTSFLYIRDPFGHFPIEYAVQYGRREMTRWFLNEHLKEHQKDQNREGKAELEFRRTMLLHSAAEKDWHEIVGLLVDCGFDQNGCDDLGETPLHTASRATANEALERLLELGASTDIQNRNKDAALVVATCSANLAGVTKLLQSGAKADQPGYRGQHALHHAAQSGSISMAKELLKYGADPNAKRSSDERCFGETPTFFAAASGSAEMVRLFTTRGGRLEEPDYQGLTSFHSAAISGHSCMLQFFPDSESTKIPDMNGWTPLHHTASHN